MGADNAEHGQVASETYVQFQASQHVAVVYGSFTEESKFLRILLSILIEKSKKQCEFNFMSNCKHDGNLAIPSRL